MSHQTITRTQMPMADSDIDTKQALIIQYETIQAQRLAQQVIFKPPLTVWYILIPVIFVYYFYRLSRYASGRKEFVEHYMRSIKKAIAAAADSASSNQPLRIDDLVNRSGAPAEAKKAFKAYMQVLVDHYLDLIRTDGDEVTTLIRKTYRTRSNYLLFLNRLRQVEKDLNRALAPRLEKENPDVGETVTLIERQVEQLRRVEADRIFP